MTKPWYNGKWPKVRLQILTRDRYLCQIALPEHCLIVADQVDHIVRVEDGGAWWEPSNLRAACGPCNRKWRPPTPTPPSSRDW